MICTRRDTKQALNDVLLDPKSNTVYTPNMNALTKLGNQNLTNDEMRAIMEYRKKTNWIKGAHGYFAGSYPEGGGSASVGRNSEKKDLTNKGDSDIMNLEKLPVNIPPEKFTEYALDPIRQPDKARAFREALGYTKANYQDLIDNINRNLDKKRMKFKGNNGYGDTYEYVMRLKGANSKEANVLTAWINDPIKAELRLSSAYVTDKKVTKDDKS